MSAYSTWRITRSKIQEELMRAILSNDDNLFRELMNSLLDPRLYNFVIVDDGEPNDDGIV